MNPNQLFRNLLFIALFVFLHLFGSAQDHPKIGLVLSGGGAKGIAHIGILRAMEQAGIRPDYITGTSMGSVVGGLYALGYSADEIEEMVREIDWNEILSNNVPLNSISFEEKEYYNRYLVEFPFEGFKLKLPSGLIDGQLLSETLQHYCWPANQYESFDDFPIPFRCMATDVAKAESVVLKDGSLALAIRSSMALPTAFTAVPYENTLLVDGGVLNNFPVEEVIKMGADIVIGINVSTGIGNTTMPESMLGILMNLAMIPADKRVYDQIELCDLYIQPDLKGNSTASFSSTEEIIEIGNETGAAYLDQFEALASKLNKPYVEPSIPELGKIKIDSVLLSGNRLFSDELLEAKLNFNSDSLLSQDEIEQSVRRVFGINGFSKVTYALKPSEKGEYNLDIEMSEKDRTRLFASVHVDNQFSSGIVLNLTSRDLIGKESRTIIAGDISKNPRFRFDYYKYFGLEKRLALNLRYDFLAEELPVYEKGVSTDVRIDNIHLVGLNFITTQSLKQSFLFGANFQFRNTKSKFNVALPAEFKRIREEYISLDFGYTINTLNDRNFASRGSEMYFLAKGFVSNSFKVILENDFQDFQGPVDEIVEELTPGFYGQIQFNGRTYYKLTKSTQLVPYVALGFTLADADSGTFIRSFNLGGYQRRFINDTRAYGLNYAEIAQPNIFLMGIQTQTIIKKNFFLKFGGNLYGTYNYLPISDINELSLDEITESIAFGYGTELSWRTPIGPISGGISTNTSDGYLRYYFALGFSFNYSD